MVIMMVVEDDGVGEMMVIMMEVFKARLDRALGSLGCC